ncbi:homoserine kinase [Altererythrobacter xiamenensis]|uniref:Homoserine kinase n=1 Tax=Altererythrobacter xiamenensis TaxID=1316679 RepID=A0A1Y6EHD7_9SPHN|nr:homoserine kinase [Altererythrobacter xiamenensis]SMQ62038.1 homoserine kinase [Altererythrobacter xiamenensis]
MAVYTHLGAEELTALIAQYDVGELVSAKGIAEGVSNSNWLIETTGSDSASSDGRGARFILTMYERRIELSDLPFFLGLLDHLSERDCPVPRTIHDLEGAAYRLLDGKAIALIEYLPGVSVDHPTPGQARAVGEALAQMHAASQDFGQTRANGLDIEGSRRMLAECGTPALASIDPALPKSLEIAARLSEDWPQDLPRAICHTDLFPDNVLMLGDQVTGMIDFYFACEDAMAYDLAVTHAAWCFDRTGEQFSQDIGAALIEGYESLRKLEPRERECLPILAQGACMRFIASRAEDWIETPADALVTRKDPMDFVRRLSFYGKAGSSAFAPSR